MELIREKIINFVKSYVSLVASLLICIVYIVIDLIVFSVESDPKVVIPKAIIYLVISTTITALLRRQGMIYGNMDEKFVLQKEDYNAIIDEIDTSDLDDFCEYKNDIRKVQLIKKKLRSAKLNYDKYENGDYEVILCSEDLKYSGSKNLEGKTYHSDGKLTIDLPYNSGIILRKGR